MFAVDYQGNVHQIPWKDAKWYIKITHMPSFTGHVTDIYSINCSIVNQSSTVFHNFLNPVFQPIHFAPEKIIFQRLEGVYNFVNYYMEHGLDDLKVAYASDDVIKERKLSCGITLLRPSAPFRPNKAAYANNYVIEERKLPCGVTLLRPSEPFRPDREFSSRAELIKDVVWRYLCFPFYPKLLLSIRPQLRRFPFEETSFPLQPHSTGTGKADTGNVKFLFGNEKLSKIYNKLSTQLPGKSIRLRHLVIAALVIGGMFMVYRALPSMPKSVDEINADPRILSGLNFYKGSLEGIDVQDVRIKELVLDDIQVEHSSFRNVTFEKCVFTRVKFQDCRFENVAFKDCLLRGRGYVKDRDSSTIFRHSVFKDVLFENSKMNNVVADLISGEGGYVYFRNMREIKASGWNGNILSGTDLHCRVLDSDFAQVDFFIYGNNNASFYARNSNFSKVSLLSGKTRIEQCRLRDTEISAEDITLVSDSLLDHTSMYSYKSCYYVHNRYTDSSEVKEELKEGNRVTGYDHSPVYVAHQDAAPARLGFNAGRVSAADITLQDPTMVNQAVDRKPPLRLNLRNVRIVGGFWHLLLIDGGQWENVAIEPSVRVDETTLKNIQAYNLEFPEGDPWKKEGKFSPDITRSEQPFDWPEVRVPTPADMGLEWWPTEPGYHPEK
ncbi:MAG: pentapeptide repeat-containing protein [Deltaproteobacteria bacterium]|nr:pentapeptide repeat-containing protein [Deltaproteobacteria bacterium]